MRRKLAKSQLSSLVSAARVSWLSCWDPSGHFPQSQLLTLSSLLQISVATLRLFEELVWLPDQRILQSLVLRHLEERSYVLRSPLGQEDLAVPEQEFCEEGL